MKPTFLPAFTLAIPLLFHPTLGWSQDAPTVRLAPQNLGAEDRFGCALSLFGDTLVVGSLNDDQVAPDAGALYVYQHTPAGWGEPVKLVVPGAAPREQLGFNVATDGVRIAAGAPGGGGSGAVQLFAHDAAGAWRPAGRLEDPALGAGAAFGSVVALAVGLVAVGAPRGFGGGSVTVFNLAGQVVARVTPGEGSRGSFGWTLAFDGSTLVVGAPGAEGSGGSGGGRVDVYQRQGNTAGFALVATLTAPDGQAFDGFGFSVAQEGDRLAIGAPNAGARGAGQVYVFRGGGANWQHEVTFEPIPAGSSAVGDHFGAALSWAANRLWVGAPGFAGRRGGVASFFLHPRLGWIPGSPTSPPGARAGDEAGIALDTNFRSGGRGSVTVTGAFLDSLAARHAGAVYVTAPRGDLSVTLRRVGSGLIFPGDQVTLEVRVTNLGPSPVDAARLTVNLPAGLTRVRWTCQPDPAAGCDTGGTTATTGEWSATAGLGVTYTLVARVAPNARGNLAVTARITPPPGWDEVSLGDLSARVELPISELVPEPFRPPALTVGIDPIASVDPDDPGEPSVFRGGLLAATLRVQNGAGAGPLVNSKSGHEAVLTFGFGLTAVTAVANRGHAKVINTGQGFRVVWNGSLEPGDEVVIETLAQVARGLPLPATRIDLKPVANFDSDGDELLDRTLEGTPVRPKLKPPAIPTLRPLALAALGLGLAAAGTRFLRRFPG